MAGPMLQGQVKTLLFFEKLTKMNYLKVPSQPRKIDKSETKSPHNKNLNSLFHLKWCTYLQPPGLSFLSMVKSSLFLICTASSFNDYNGSNLSQSPKWGTGESSVYATNGKESILRKYFWYTLQDHLPPNSGILFPRTAPQVKYEMGKAMLYAWIKNSLPWKCSVSKYLYSQVSCID